MVRDPVNDDPANNNRPNHNNNDRSGHPVDRRCDHLGHHDPAIGAS